MSTDKGTIAAYERAYTLACAKLAGKDPSIVAELAGVRYDAAAHWWFVEYLGEEYIVEHPSGQVNRADGPTAAGCRDSGSATTASSSGDAALAYQGLKGPTGLGDVDLPQAPDDRNVPVTPRILILHYLLNAMGTRPSGRLAAFREMPGGDIYVAPFTARTIKPLAAVFGSNGRALVQAGLELGGHVAQVGHHSVTVNALPRVPITLAVWEGDDEFPASASILFDSTAPDYLSTEDLVVLAGETVRACARLAAAYA